MKQKRIQNHELVFAALRKTAKPLTAYELLDRLRPHGVSAPPTVYRALERLIEDGRAHRLESLNAFVACTRPQHGEATVFTICHGCGAFEELSDVPLNKRIAVVARDASFDLDRAVLELHGRCHACGEDTPPAAD